MKSSVRLRLLLLTLVIGILAAVIVGAATVTWREVAGLRARFSSGRIESLHIAEHIQAAVLTLNATLLRFVLRRNRGDWQSFTNDVDALAVWLKVQQPGTSLERQKVTQVIRELQFYRSEANAIAINNERGTINASNVVPQIESASQQLLSLGYELESARRMATDQLVDTAQKSLTLLQEIIFGALGFLILLGAWAVALVYREMIAPLRRKIVEFQAEIERQEKLASLGVLAAGVAHEIRNPLTAINARVFTLRKTIGERSAAIEDVEVIGGEISRLERIVREVLLFARPNKPRIATLAIGILFREIHDLMEPQLNSKNIQISIDCLRDITIRADSEQLKQVLLNLIRNGAESIGENGRIRLRADCRRMNIGGNPSDSAVIEVEDNGKGISVEVQKRLFDPFYTTKPTGTGLGLAIAARIVEQHGGFLRYQTEIGRGTNFEIVLPL